MRYKSLGKAGLSAFP